jgi:acetoin utilization deacetylase AcuC-like enzyme
MQTGYLYSPEFLAHTQRNHPESHVRLEAVMALFHQHKMQEHLTEVSFGPASFEQLRVVHDPSYVAQVEQLSTRGGGMLGPDTYVNRHTYDVASLAAGAAITAVNVVLGDDLHRAFALVRPPGHHAFADHGEGFCIFNNIAFSALRALGDLGGHEQPVVERVMIVDWDVHHGNGTEDIFYRDPRVLYVSTHQSLLYPGTGRLAETGEGPGRGTTMNIPLPPGVGDKGYIRVFNEIIVPAAHRFRPQLILVSAGYDAHWRDMLAHMKMSLVGLARIATIVAQLSDELCGGRMVVVLEGGYDLEVLSYGVLNTLYVMNGNLEQVADPVGPSTSDETPVDQVIRRVKQVHDL